MFLNTRPAYWFPLRPGANPIKLFMTMPKCCHLCKKIFFSQKLAKSSALKSVRRKWRNFSKKCFIGLSPGANPIKLIFA